MLKKKETELFVLSPLLSLQHFDFPLPSPLKVFEMLVVPEQEYPLVCVAISQGTETGQVVRFETINLNSCSSWFTEMGTSESQHHLQHQCHMTNWKKCKINAQKPVSSHRCVAPLKVLLE